MSIEFENTVEGMELLAAYVGGLVKAGVTFRLRKDKFAVQVELTGGF
jgi:hypothetical protein